MFQTALSMDTGLIALAVIHGKFSWACWQGRVCRGIGNMGDGMGMGMGIWNGYIIGKPTSVWVYQV